MKQPEIILIAAMSKNNVIGIDGKIPWRIKEDMEHFKNVTMSHPVVMGRVTYESIPQKFRPLPGRHNVVLTANTSFSERGVLRCSSLEDALDVLGDRRSFVDGIDYNQIFIGGGQQVYEKAMEYATSLEMTHVDHLIDVDLHLKQGLQVRYFPEIIPAHWQEQKREDKQGYSFVTYKKR